MATRQLLSLRSFIPDSLGNPARTAYVHILEPGTTVAVTSYKDGALQNANVNPVPLSASAKASIWVSRDVDVLITLGPLLTDPVLVDEKNANPDVAGATSSGLVPNGSFENDSDADDVPDGWTETAEVGSNNGIDNAVSSDGLQSFRFSSVGTGGGNLITTDFFAVNDVDDLRVNFDIQSSVADVRNIVRVEWFDVSQVPISNTDVYDNAISNPVTFTPQQLVATPPAGARFAKLRLIGCDPSDVTPGSTWYDRINVFYPLVVAGVFDNITIQNNEIISTNTNGRIQLRPNGNGSVDITSDGFVDLTDADNPLNVGNTDDPSANQHIAMDQGSIQSKSDGTTAAALSINPLGGQISLGPNARVLANLLSIDAGADADVARRSLNSLGGVDLGLFSGTGNVGILQTDSAGVLEDTWIALTRNGGVQLNNNDVARLLTNGTGAQVLGSILELENSAAADTGILAHNTAGGIQMRVIGAGTARIDQLSAAGAVEDTWVELTRNGGISLRDNNIERLAINTTGYTASGTVFAHVNAANTLTELEVRNSTGGVQVGVQVGGDVLISQTDSAGLVEDEWIEMRRNGEVELNHNNIGMARTATAANGGLQVNNTVTGAGYERVLTTSDITATVLGGGVLAAAQNVNNSTTLVDSGLSAPLQPSAEYIIEATLVFAGNGATANGFRWGLDFNGQIANLDTLFGGSFSWQNSSAIESIIDAGSGGTSQTKATFDGAGVRETVKVSLGVITQSDFVADTNVDIQFAQGTSDATNTTLEEGSSLKVTRVG